MSKKRLLLSSVVLCFMSLFSQETGEYKFLSDVEVIADKVKVESEQLRIIYSITKEKIAQLPVSSIDDLLEYLPGVDVRSRGTNGVQADLSIRGGTFDQVLILINGVNFTDVQTGHYNLDLPVVLSQIERIEVLQGTSVNLFGLNAFSGAINIVTQQSSDNGAVFSLTMGENGLFMPAVKVDAVARKLSFTGAVSHSSSSGYIENTDYKMNNIFLQTSYKNSETGNFNLQIGGQTKDYGANAFYSATYPNQFDAVKTLLTSLQWQKSIDRFMLESSAFYRRHHDRFELFRDNKDVPAWYKAHNYHLTDVVGGNFKTSYFSKIGKTSAGVELRNEHIYSTVLGDKLKKTVKIPLEQTDTFFTLGKNRLNVNYFAEQIFFINKLSISLGASGNYNTMFGNNFAFGANLGYEFMPSSRLYVNFNRSLRLPTFTDLYYKSATQRSNPNLKPEESLNAEIGAKFVKNNLYSNITLFFRHGTDIIDWIKPASADSIVWQSVNHTKITNYGGEMTVGYNFTGFLKNVEVSYSYINANKAKDGFMSKYALDYLKHKLSLSVEHNIVKNVSARWQYTIQERNGEYNNKNKEVVKYRPFGLLDLKVSWTNRRFNLFLNATNILDTKYYDFGGLTQPGRWVKAGIEIAI